MTRKSNLVGQDLEGWVDEMDYHCRSPFCGNRYGWCGR